MISRISPSSTTSPVPRANYTPEQWRVVSDEWREK
jgi:hypothetical protein